MWYFKKCFKTEGVFNRIMLFQKSSETETAKWMLEKSLDVF